MRNLFAIDDVTYLNSASLGPRLHAVNAAGHAAVDAMAAPWKVRTPDWFEDARRLRALFASLIGASAECAALVPSVSYGIAVAARNVPVAAGENIVVIDQEYPSNYYSWKRLARERGAEMRTAVAPGEGSITDAIVSAIDRRTDLHSTAADLDRLVVTLQELLA
jgi:selenocysteine lyase/cysteine desulfurase